MVFKVFYTDMHSIFVSENQWLWYILNTSELHYVYFSSFDPVKAQVQLNVRYAYGNVKDAQNYVMSVKATSFERDKSLFVCKDRIN